MSIAKTMITVAEEPEDPLEHARSLLVKEAQTIECLKMAALCKSMSYGRKMWAKNAD
eukprot:CAMPEP_0170486980 /NCGR_PEP_ID=MMETSP0208-20121228/5863_1 /TAXON_ID=197538 /ORGANISM="Strombidium inclinatum, Strain S3" /LENGTH=56 /DNA_ID=CAMNT_0010761077 /DNA_START=420 /DNA_END=590 /DNA_ORIENTATION=-